MLEQLLAPLILAVFSVGFAVIWFKNREIKAAINWSLAYGLLGMGFLFESFVPKTEEAFWVRLTGDSGYVFGTLFFSVALITYFDRKIPIKWFASFATAMMCFQSYFYFGYDSIQARSEIMAYGTTVLAFSGVVVVFTAAKMKLEKILLYLVIASTSLNVINTFYTFHILNTEIQIANFTQSLYLEIIILTSTFFSLLCAIVIAVMLTMRFLSALREEANTDKLTGLRNRRAVEVGIEELLKSSDQINMPSVLLVCDIDFFKTVNDTFGHANGDLVIKKIAKVLENSVRKTDLVGRIGGEEFVVLMPNATESMGYLIAETIRTRIATTNWKNLHTDLRITISIGVAEAKYQEPYHSLFERADKALYDAKANGRNMVVVDQIEYSEKSALSLA